MDQLPRGLSELQEWIMLWCRMDRRGGDVLARDVRAGWAHHKFSGGRVDRCDCPGRCLLVTRAHDENVRRSILRLEAKGLVTRRYDWYGRLVYRSAPGVPTWQPGQHGPLRGDDPGLCPECGQPRDLMAG